MAEQSAIAIPADVFNDFLAAILRALGCDEENARAIADGFVEADLRGNTIQGSDHIYSVVSALRSGRVNGRARPRVVAETAATARVDGDGAAGHVGGRFAAELAVEKAASAGLGAIGLVRAGDIFSLGGYVERIAAAGLVGMAFTTSLYTSDKSLFVGVHVAGGIDPALGTNPLAIAFPRHGDDPIVADLATSTSAMGHIRLATYSGEPIPEGVAIDRDGNPTTDPFQALEGALTPLGGHKGFALGLAVALMTGPMVGAEIGSALKADAVADAPPRLGHFFLALDPGTFGPLDDYEARLGTYVAELKAGRRAAGVEEIRLPGERGFRARAESLASGVQILPDTWRELTDFALQAGVQPPALHASAPGTDPREGTEKGATK